MQVIYGAYSRLTTSTQVRLLLPAIDSSVKNNIFKEIEIMKKLIAIFLCVALSMPLIACERENSVTENRSEVATGITPTPVIINEAEAKVDDAVKAFEKIVSDTKSVTASTEGTSHDYAIELRVSPTLMSELFGLNGFESIELYSTISHKDTTKLELDSDINGRDLIDAEIFVDNEKVYIGLPKYTDEYLELSLEELLSSPEYELQPDDTALGTDVAGTSSGEMQTSILETLESLPSVTELIELIETYTINFMSCFKPEADIQNDIEVGIEDYKFTGTRYSLVAKAEDLDKVLEDFGEELKKYFTSVEISTLKDTGYSELHLNYYVGSNNAEAWELVADNGDTCTYVSTSYGAIIYTVVGGETNILLYTENLNDNETVLTLVGVTGTDEDIQVVHTNNNGTHNFGYKTDEMRVDLSYKAKVDTVDISMSLEISDTYVKAEVYKNDKSYDFGLTVESNDEELVCLDVYGTNKVFKEFSLPDKGLDSEAWLETLDLTRLQNDLQELGEKFSFSAEDNTSGNTGELSPKVVDRVSENWYNMQFIFNGAKYTIPFKFSELYQAGYDLDLLSLGYEDGYMLEPYCYTNADIKLPLAKSGYKYSAFTPTVGFINNSEISCELEECDIWSFAIGITSDGIEIAERYPNVELSKGITWGTTYEEIKAAYGESESSFESDIYGCMEYVYFFRDKEYERDIYLKLTVSNNFGLVGFQYGAY